MLKTATLSNCKHNVKYVRGANFVGSGGLTVTIKAQKDTEVIIWINVK